MFATMTKPNQQTARQKYQAHSQSTSTTQTALANGIIKNNTSKNWEHFYTVLKHNIFSSKLISLYLKTCTQNTEQAQNVFLE
jgi:hypothetical protein